MKLKEENKEYVNKLSTYRFISNVLSLKIHKACVVDNGSEVLTFLMMWL